MKPTLLIVAFVVAFAGCKKKEDNKESAKSAEPAAAAPATPPAQAAPPAGGEPSAAGAQATKSEYKPDELWKATAGVSRMDLMEKFKDGVTVTGAVKTVKDDPAGEYVLELDAGGGHTVAAEIAVPAAAREKKLKAGDTVTVTKCMIANPTDALLPLRTCDLK
jgi:hypothetical protein